MNKKGISLTAIIPVREGSTRLKNKNIAPFAGTNLLLHKIEQLKKVNLVDNIVVSSDSDLMLEMAKNAGVSTHKRTIEYCDDKTKPFGEVVGHICENVKGDNIIWSPVTAPLLFKNTYMDIINKYYEVLDQGYQSLATFEIFKEFLWNENGPVNYKLGLKHTISQCLPNMYIMTWGAIIAPRVKMIEWRYVHDENPYKYILDKRTSMDIDDGLDLVAARAWLDMDESVSHIDPFQIK